MESKSKKFPVGLVLTTKEYLTRLGKASLIFCASNDFMVGVNIVASLFSSLFILLVHTPPFHLFLEKQRSVNQSQSFFYSPRGKTVTACTYTKSSERETREQKQGGKQHWPGIKEKAVRRPCGDPQTAACQALLSVRFPRQGYWSGLPFHPLGDLPESGIKPMSLESSAL